MDEGDEKEAQGWVERNEILFSYEDKDYHGDAPSQPNNRRWKSFISLLSPFLLSSFKIVSYFSPFKKNSKTNSSQM